MILPMTEEDAFLLERAVAEGLLARDQADDCQTIAAVGGNSKPIREILAQKGLLAADQIDRLIKIYKVQSQEREDRALAQYVVAKGKVQEADLRTCLAEQKASRVAGKYVPLGRILVARNLLDKTVLKEIQFGPEFHSYVEKEKLTRLPAAGAAAKPPEEKGPAERLAGYELRTQIARGGMGIIYRAWQIGLEREVALKLLAPQLQDKPDFVAKFLREAKMAAKLSHPNLVHIYDIGQEGTRHYYTMEFVEGTNLHELLVSENRLPKERAIDFLLQIAKALAAIHEQGIVHRDIKPDNIIIRKDGIAKLVDLGLAKQTDPSKATTETTMGNPFYIAPELISSPDKVDFRADIYSLGATFYRMLTGRRPVEGETPAEIIDNLVNGEPVSVQEIDYTISDDIAKLCRRMMHKDPAKRYMSMDMVVKAIDKILFME